MANEVDPLDRKVGVEIAWTWNSVSLKASSRAVAAFDRLVGNFFDKRSLNLEPGIRHERSILDARSKIVAATVDGYIQQMESNPVILNAAIEQHLDGLVRKLENKIAIVEIAKEDLRRLPPTQAPEVEIDISEDWMNDFESFAEKASSDDMRLLFGKILSGETRMPGSFSKKSMRTLWELDEKSADAFRTLASVRFQKFVPTDIKGELSELLTLESMGLLNSGIGLISASWNVSADKTVQASEDYCVVVEMQTGAKELSFKAVSLTPAGVEIASLFENNEITAIRRIAEMAKEQYKKIDVFRINYKFDTTVNVDLSSPVETILGNAKI